MYTQDTAILPSFFSQLISVSFKPTKTYFPVIIKHSFFDAFLLWFLIPFILFQLHSLKLTLFNYSDCGWLRNTATGTNQVNPLKCWPLTTVNLRTGVRAHSVACSAWFVLAPTALLISGQLDSSLLVCPVVNIEQFKALKNKGRWYVDQLRYHT